MADRENTDWFDGQTNESETRHTKLDTSDKATVGLKRKKSIESNPSSKTGRYENNNNSIDQSNESVMSYSSSSESESDSDHENDTDRSKVNEINSDAKGSMIENTIKNILQKQNDSVIIDRQKPGSVKMTGMRIPSHYGSQAQDEYLNVTDENGWSKQQHQLKKDRRQLNKRNVNQTDPEEAEYPVILEDIGDSQKGHKKFQNYGQFTENLFRDSGLAPIRRQRRLASGKWLIHCNSAASQSKLANCNSLGKNDEVKIKCFIPTHKTIGVIRAVPTSVSMEQIVNGNKDITYASRLHLREGGESRAVKVFFSCQVLPTEIRLGNELVMVTPYVELVVRCTKCQKFNHKKAKCTAKIAICPNCGNKAHDQNDSKLNRDLCPATVSYCINCQSAGHSAAWGGCPKLKLLQKAHAESSRLGVPVGLVVHKFNDLDCIPKDLHNDRNFYYRYGPSKPPTPTNAISGFSYSDIVTGHNITRGQRPNESQKAVIIYNTDPWFRRIKEIGKIQSISSLKTELYG